jgi:hypothetical protein
MNLIFFKKKFNKGTFFALSSLFLLATVLSGANLFAAFSIAFILSVLCIVSFHLIKDPDSVHLFRIEESDEEGTLFSIGDKKKAITPQKDWEDLQRRKAVLKTAWEKAIARQEEDETRLLKTRP